MLSFLVATLLGFPLSQLDRRGVLRLAGAALASSPAVRSASAAPTPGPITTLSTGEAFPLASFGLLFAAFAYKDAHPTNLYLTFGFTVAMGWGVAVTCARFQAAGLGLVVLEAVGLTASVTAALTAYTLKSKEDFSYLGAGLGSALWILILGGLIASLTGLPTMHFALAVGGAVIFSLYIVYDVWEISKRLSPDEYITAAISLYLDIVNLFLHILRILASLQSRD